jgi:hypothetical protein
MLASGIPFCANPGEELVQQAPDESPKASAARAEYARRLDERRATVAMLARREALVGNLRVVVFVAGLVLLVLVFWTGHVAPGWLAVPGVLFLPLLIAFDRVRSRARHAGRAVTFYERGLARLDDRWAGLGEPGERFLAPEHAYAADLDLFGHGSLFELLCTARTRAGQDTLAGWLLAPAGVDVVLQRQAAVADLRPRLDLREAVAVLGADVPGGVDFDVLARWGQDPPLLAARWPRVAAALLGLLNVATLAACFLLRTGLTPFLAALLLSCGFALWLRIPVGRVLAAVERRARDLALLSGVLSRLEGETFTAPRLRELHDALQSAGLPPSRQIARLVRLIDRLDWKRNLFFAPLAYLLLWDTQLAHAIEAWRAASGPAIGDWLTAVGEFEALGALAAYAYEHPDDPFPDLVAAGPEKAARSLSGFPAPCFDGQALGHPLIPAARCVRNDVSLEGELRLLVVSGSNMSGKSTLLRTVGTNAVLALAGAPVRARSLRLAPVMVGATLRIQDSLQAGQSRFYAEITRIRQLVDLARGAPPLFFLLDELFSGTNSHDRALGAEGVVRHLIDLGAVGLITTHDLALAAIADRLGPRAANVHFEDHFENGAITFDYRMRPGVVEKSNALALMRAVGLEV